jgi:cyanate permease
MSSSTTPGSAPPTWFRWTVLVLLSFAMFGNFYVYDAIGPLADTLQKELGYTATQVGLLNAIYSFPNVVMVLVGFRRGSCARYTSPIPPEPSRLSTT